MAFIAAANACSLLASSRPINAGVAQKTSNDPWDFDMLSPTVSPIPAGQSKAPADRASSPFDVFDDLEVTTSSTSQMSLNSRAPATPSTSLNTDADDDILGLLGKPVQAVTALETATVSKNARHSTDPTRSSPRMTSRPPSRAIAARTPSPPPHILGEVVSMGFSVQQARLALAATLGAEQPGKWSVTAAMEVLASDGAAHAARERENSSSSRRFDDDRDEDDEAYLRRQARKQSQKDRQRQETGITPRQETARNSTNSSNQSPLDLNANELLQQASVFGSTMLKSAGSYWKTSKAQLQKAIEEKKLSIPSVSGPSSGRNSPASTKPRWMTQDAEHVDNARDREGSINSGVQDESAFKDFTDDRSYRSQDALPAHPTDCQTLRNDDLRGGNASIPPLVHKNTKPSAERGAAFTAAPPHSASLLNVASNEKKAYASPNRRKAAASSSAPVSSGTARSPPAGMQQQQHSKPSRPPRPQVSANSGQLDTSRKRRAMGNEHFKLGRYGEAANAYTSALDALPEGHLARIAALNNRANARLKNGEERQAVEDATAVLTILSAPTELQKVNREEWEVILHDFGSGPAEGAGGEKFDARDALGKALSRRARGFEGCEKWRLAMLDWQMITELGDTTVVKSAGGMRVVSEGLSRCRKVVEGPSAKRPSPSAPKRAPPIRASKRIVPANSEALDKLRETNKKAEADEAERLKVKDSVDARISEWRGGKENNLRALIASLDNVLWDELGWKKVGMHELISDSQLKVRYVRAISKVHPDKVNAGLYGTCRALKLTIAFTARS